MGVADREELVRKLEELCPEIVSLGLYIHVLENKRRY